MGRDDETGVECAVELEHQLEHVFRRLPVQVPGRLVGEHTGGIGDQGPRNRDALTLAAGEFRRRVLEPVPEPHFAEHLDGARVRFCNWHAPDQERHRHVLDRGEFRQQMMELIDETQLPVAQLAASRLIERLDIAPADDDLAAGGGIQPAQQMQQRVAVARALANRPALVLADEPTGNLDEATADVVLAEFLRLVREEGSAALVATHNERMALKMDRVVRLHEGQLQELAD